MKKVSYLLSTLALVLVLGGNAFGQVGSTEITASAEIVGSLSLETNEEEGGLNFGQLPDNFRDVSITPSENGSPELNNVGNDAQQGEVTISSGEEESLLIDILNPENLTQEGGEDAIPFNGTYVGQDGESIGGTQNEITTDTDGDYTIYLGGSLESGDYSTGNYSGTITIEVDYSL